MTVASVIRHGANVGSTWVCDGTSTASWLRPTTGMPDNSSIAYSGAGQPARSSGAVGRPRRVQRSVVLQTDEGVSQSTPKGLDRQPLSMSSAMVSGCRSLSYRLDVRPGRCSSLVAARRIDLLSGASTSPMEEEEEQPRDELP